MKPTIPLYKAEKFYGNNEVIGSLLRQQDKLYIVKEAPYDTCLSFIDGEYVLEDYDLIEYIKPETLRISFDGGENWYEINYVSELIRRDSLARCAY